MTTEPTLLPCPFCGSDTGGPSSETHLLKGALYRRSKHNPPVTTWWVCCHQCDLAMGLERDCGGEEFGKFHTPEAAAEAWNRRAVPAVPVMRRYDYTAADLEILQRCIKERPDSLVWALVNFMNHWDVPAHMPPHEFLTMWGVFAERLIRGENILGEPQPASEP